MPRLQWERLPREKWARLRDRAKARLISEGDLFKLAEGKAQNPDVPDAASGRQVLTTLLGALLAARLFW